MMHHRHSSRAFTLVELMIVIAIIGILAGIMVPNYMKSRREAKLSACISNLKTIDTALQAYRIRHKLGRAATGISTRLVDEGYLKAELKCPESGKKYSFGYGGTTECPMYIRIMCLGAHKDVVRDSLAIQDGIVEIDFKPI